MEDELEQSNQTTRVEKNTLSDDNPIEQSDQREQDPNAVSQEQEQDTSLDKANCEPSDSKKIDISDNEDKPSKAEMGDNSCSSTTESKAPAEPQEMDSSVAVSSSQPIRGRQYQLAFDVDDTGSEASLTSSPRSVDMNNPVMSYLSQHHYLPSPMASQSRDLESLSHDMMPESHDHKEEMAESVDDSGGDAKGKASAACTSVEDDASSVYSSSTLRPGSVTEQGQPTKPPATEKEREESVKTPDSVVKMEDITLTTESPDSSRHETPPREPKVHALNILTSDSDAGESPPYSPVPYLSGELATTGRSERVCMIPYRLKFSRLQTFADFVGQSMAMKISPMEFQVHKSCNTWLEA